MANTQVEARCSPAWTGPVVRLLQLPRGDAPAPDPGLPLPARPSGSQPLPSPDLKRCSSDTKGLFWSFSSLLVLPSSWDNMLGVGGLVGGSRGQLVASVLPWDLTVGCPPV